MAEPLHYYVEINRFDDAWDAQRGKQLGYPKFAVIAYTAADAVMSAVAHYKSWRPVVSGNDEVRVRVVTPWLESVHGAWPGHLVYNSGVACVD